jgi:aspartate carbamoyltransferase
MWRMISSKNVTAKYVNNLFKKADKFKVNHYTPKWQDKILVNAFFEPSTRTSMSFESAMYRLGGNVINYNQDVSSAKKGESYEDTIKTLSSYGHILVLRHPEKGMVDEANKYSNIPVINAGDGDGEHPTQSLLDLYTIHSNFKLNDEYVKVLFIGDIKHSRTIHSLLHLFKNYNRIKVYFLPYEGKGPDYNMLANTAIAHEQILEDITIDRRDLDIGEFDVIYCTRMQSERNSELRRPDFIVNKELLKDAKENAIIMHPFPRNSELSSDVDDDPRNQYFQQMRNGLYVRMALIDNILEGVPLLTQY